MVEKEGKLKVGAPVKLLRCARLGLATDFQPQVQQQPPRRELGAEFELPVSKQHPDLKLRTGEVTAHQESTAQATPQESLYLSATKSMISKRTGILATAAVVLSFAVDAVTTFLPKLAILSPHVATALFAISAISFAVHYGYEAYKAYKCRKRHEKAEPKPGILDSIATRLDPKTSQGASLWAAMAMASAVRSDIAIAGAIAAMAIIQKALSKRAGRKPPAAKPPAEQQQQKSAEEEYPPYQR